MESSQHKLTTWQPEDNQFWENTGKKIAWRTLIITTIALIFSFSTWFLMSVVAVKMPDIGFKFTKSQLYWIATLPGLLGGLFRIVNTFVIPLFGTRKVITVSTFIKIIPLILLGFALNDTNSSFEYFLFISFLLGLGGGDFSSYMPSTSIFFPKSKQGTALGIQAGIGNFGVSLTQMLAPWIITFALFGALGGDAQNSEKGGHIWLQNSAYIYIIPLFIIGLIAWFYLKSIPVKASFQEQLDIFSNKHTWFCTITYMMTFGTFAGFSAIFPLLIKEYSKFPGGPDPLHYAFLGPLIGSLSRVLFGPVADKKGGAILTHWVGILLIACFATLYFKNLFTPNSLNDFPLFLIIMLIIFFITGIGNAATFRQYPIIFAHSPRQAAGVVGFTAAIAAFGPFLFASLKNLAGNHNFLLILLVFFIITTAINWYYYTRKNCEKPS